MPSCTPSKKTKAQYPNSSSKSIATAAKNRAVLSNESKGEMQPNQIGAR